VKTFARAAIAAGVLGLASMGAQAAGTHTVAVSATVQGICIVTGANANSTLSWGNINGITGPFTATWTSGSFSCTNGSAYTVSSNDGLWETAAGGANNRMKLSSATDCSTATNCIRYTMPNVTSGTGAGLGTGISFNVTGTTTAADMIAAPAGNYADTVILTVNP